MRRWPALPYVTAAIGLALLSQGIQSAQAVASTSASFKQQSALVAQNVVVALEASVPLDFAQPDPERAALEHIRTHPQLLGLSNETFVLKNVVHTIGGIATVRFTQVIEDMPVMGSLLSLTVDSRGALLSYSVRTSVTPRTGTAGLTQTQVVNVAIGELASRLKVHSGDVEIVSSESFIADSATLIGLSGGSHVVWRVRAIVDSQPWELYIDDASSTILVVSNPGHSAVGDVTPLICNWQSATVAPVLSSPVGRNPNILCSDTSSVISDASDSVQASERQRLSDGINLATLFFSNYLNVDIRDEHYLGNISPQLNYSDGTKANARTSCTAAGTLDTPEEQPITAGTCAPRISAFYDYCVDTRESPSQPWSCPIYGNAFWNPWQDKVDLVEGANCRSKYCSGLYFGRGFAADDVVAHELSHSVIGGEAFLEVPNAETDALSEVFADIFGEAVDQLNVKPGEAADKNWNFGEDVGVTTAGAPIPGVVLGPFRTIRRAQSFESKSITSGWSIQGEPHDNLGPGDRFAWLIANGGKQGKYTIKAIGSTPWGASNDGLCQADSECTGVIRMSQLAMNALTKLAGASTYYDFGRAMIASCNDFVVAGVGGFTAKHCSEVRKALVATNILKITAKPLGKLKAVKAGSLRTLKGRIVTSTGAGAPNIPVKLQRKSGAKWVTVAASTTDVSGYARFALRFKKSATYRFITVKSTQVLKLTSSSRRITVS